MAPAPTKGKGGDASAKRTQHPNKLPRVQQGYKIKKRPLPRPQQPASSNAHLVYVSKHTPFMSIVKRVRKTLDRSLQGHAPATRGMTLPQRVAVLNREGGTRGGDSGSHCEVTILGTGAVIEKTLSVASWFTAQGDCEVDVRTKTVGTVDDVVPEDGADDGFEEESRVRMMSCLEVVVKLK